MSPEEVEGQVEQIEEQEEQKEEKPRRIEVDPDELKELRESNRRMQEELHQHKLWQMQQYQEKQKPADIQVDPDVERVIAPVVQKALRPIQEENERLKNQLVQNSEQLRVQANIDYIERNIPNFEEVRLDLAKEIESMPKNEQDMVLSSPTLMVKLAQAINANRGKSSKQEARSRSFSESSTGTSPSKNTSAIGNVDWENLSPAEFAAQEAKIEMARRKR